VTGSRPDTHEDAEISCLTKERDAARAYAAANQENCDAWYASAKDGGARVAGLIDAMRQAEEWFRAYGQGHDAKGDTDRTKRNHDRANFCARAELGRDAT
jgi:surface antigen